MTTTPAEQVEQNFRVNARRYRELADMTQADLATKMGAEGFPFYPQTIYKLERGERQLRLVEAAALARALEVPLEVLLGDPGANAIGDAVNLVARARRAVEVAVQDYEDAQDQLASAADEQTLSDEVIHSLQLVEELKQTAVEIVTEYRVRMERLRLSYIQELEATDTEHSRQLLALQRGEFDGEFQTLLRRSRG